jgi:hypothetical protein
MSYVGLFSYYQFDNWAYQPSYVSSNTPWFFNGVRVQWFPTAKLKIEPWFINGWQSYGRFNSRPGLGGQILYRPNGRWSFLGNQSGYGEDALGVPSRTRYHTDDSVQYKYYQSSKSFISVAAATLTGDMGCESGGGVSCFGNGKNGPKQSFLGFMFYNRFRTAVGKTLTPKLNATLPLAVELNNIHFRRGTESFKTAWSVCRKTIPVIQPEISRLLQSIAPARIGHHW